MGKWISEHKGTIVVLVWLVIMVVMADHYYNFRFAEKATSFIHNINPVVDDCGSDKSCFEKHLEFCEKAIYKPKAGTILLNERISSWQAPYYILQATESTEVRIVEAMQVRSEYERRLLELDGVTAADCKVFYKDVNVIRKNYDGNIVFTDIATLYCYYRTNPPSAQEHSVSVRWLEECKKVRK